MKKLFCVIMGIALLLSLSSCKNNTNVKDTSDSQTIDLTSKAQENTSAVSDKTLFKKGVWQSQFNGQIGSLYSFTADGKDCKFYAIAEKGTLPYSYTVTDSGYDFYINGSETPVHATIVFKDENTAELTWETMEIENLTFLEDIPLNDYLEKHPTFPENAE